MTTNKCNLACKKVLPKFEITITCSEDDLGATPVHVGDQTYFVSKLNVQKDGTRSDGMPAWVPFRFNLYPVVFCGDGVPWPEANLFIIGGLENTPTPDMRTFDAHALDLADFRRFIEADKVDWMSFPASKLLRPTYRYRSHLNFELRSGELSAKTLNRRMSTVVAFYRWLMAERMWQPEHSPWMEKDVYITFKDKHGFSATHKVVSTDLAVHIPKQDDPYDETIQDGGRLRPLPKVEQDWLLDALMIADNPEMTMIHMIGMLSGARLQTICTMKLQNIALEVDDERSDDVRIAIGSGTGVDSKGGKQMVIQLPIWLYRWLHVYANSDRALQRRIKAGSDYDGQYLFLTKSGHPYYSNKEYRSSFDPDNKCRYDRDGGAVGTFIRNVIRPYIQKKYGVKVFSFRFHDTRATFGMNLTDLYLEKVERGEMSLGEIREYVKSRMGHKSVATTDLYLNYRHNLKFVRKVVGDHESHLKGLCERAMEGFL